MPKVTWRQGGFGKGMVLNRDPRDLGPGESPYILNMYMRNGALRTIPRPSRVFDPLALQMFSGSAVTTLGGAGQVASVRPFGLLSNVATFVVCIEPTSGTVHTQFLLKVTQTSAYTLFQVVELAKSDRLDSQTWAGCIGLNGSAVSYANCFQNSGNYIQACALSTGTITTTAVTAGIVYDMCYHQSHWWHVNSAAVGTIMVSDPDSLANPESNSYAVGDPSEKIVKLFPYDDNMLLVFKEHSIWIIRGTPGSDSISIQMVTDKLGCMAQSTVKRLWGSSVLCWLSSDGRVVAMPTLGDMQYVGLQVNPEHLRGVSRESVESVSGAIPYAAVNQLGHYMLLSSDVSGTAGGGALRGMLFDTANNWWCSYFDMASDENTVATRFVADSCMMYRKYGDVIPTPCQTVWQDFAQFYGTANFQALVPEILFDNPDTDDEVYSKWAIRTRPARLPSDEPFVVDDASVLAATMKTRLSSILLAFDNDRYLTVSGSPVGSNILVNASIPRGGKSACGIAHDGTTTGTCGLYRSGLSLDVSQYTSFEAYVTIAPHRNSVVDPSKIRVELTFQDASPAAEVKVVAYGSISTVGRQKVTFTPFTAVSSTAVTQVDMTVRVSDTTGQFIAYFEDLRGVMTSEDSSRDGAFEVAYSLTPERSSYTKNVASDRLVAVQSAILHSSDMGLISEMRKIRLPPWVKSKVSGASLMLSHDHRCSGRGNPVTNILKNARYMNISFECDAEPALTIPVAPAINQTPRPLVQASPFVDHASASLGEITIANCGSDKTGWATNDTAPLVSWMHVRAYTAANAKKYLCCYFLCTTIAAPSASPPFCANGLYCFQYRNGSGNDVIDFYVGSTLAYTKTYTSGGAYREVLARSETVGGALVVQVWLDKSTTMEFTATGAAGTTAGRYVYFGKMDDGTILSGADANVSQSFSFVRYNRGDIRLPLEVMAFQDVVAELWTPEFIRGLAGNENQ